MNTDAHAQKEKGGAWPPSRRAVSAIAVYAGDNAVDLRRVCPDPPIHPSNDALGCGSIRRAATGCRERPCQQREETEVIRHPTRPAPPVQKEGTRINEEISVREVHLIDKDGTNRGIVPISEALTLAQEAGLDLVEIAPNATPPVVKLLDYGKHRKSGRE